MNSLIISFLVLILWLFGLVVRRYTQKGKVKEGFCALWFMNTMFAICGVIVIFILYPYPLYPFLTLRNLLLCLMYLTATILFLLLAPSGLSILRKRRSFSEEEVLLSEYRFNDILSLVRNFFLVLLFALPVFFAVLSTTANRLVFLSAWREDEICGGFCFGAFLILLPVSLRQALFWLRNLHVTPGSVEDTLLRKYRNELHYQRHNFRI